MSGLLGTYGYMLVFPLLGVFAYLCNQYHVKEKSVIKVMLCVYVVLFAMRGLKVGFDYYNYAVVFQYAKRLDSLTFFASTRYMEIGYLLLNKLVLLFTRDIRIFQALIAAVYSVCVYRFTVRFTDSPLMAFTIFYGLGSMFNLMNLTRSALACAICLEAFIQFERSKWKRGFLFVGWLV